MCPSNAPIDDDAPSVNYCYRCGRRVAARSESCYYCGSETGRTIRPPRRCPFCDMQIRSKAVKCPHCGEFLDGRREAERPAATASAQDPRAPNVTYVIDKAIITTPGEVQAAARGRVPADRALGEPSTPAIEGPGARSLPAPVEARDDVVDIVPAGGPAQPDADRIRIIIGRSYLVAQGQHGRQ